MRLIILLAALAIALPFVIANAALPFGNAVSMRFLERPTDAGALAFTIPPETETGKPIDVASLIQWVAERRESANGYAMRVIPLDMFYLLFLGGFLAMASAALAGSVILPRAVAGMSVWVWWALPIVYMLSDFSEDTLIFMTLTWPSTISSPVLAFLAVSRSVKIGSISLAIIQVVLLGLLSYVRMSRSAPRGD
jgi:hypothetical protein